MTRRHARPGGAARSWLRRLRATLREGAVARRLEPDVGPLRLWIAAVLAAYTGTLVLAPWLPWPVLVAVAALGLAGLAAALRSPAALPPSLVAAGAWIPLHLVLIITGGTGSPLTVLLALWAFLVTRRTSLAGSVGVAGAALLFLWLGDVWLDGFRWSGALGSALAAAIGLGAARALQTQRATGAAAADRLVRILEEARSGGDGEEAAAARRLDELEDALHRLCQRLGARRAVFWDVDGESAEARPRLVSGGGAPPHRVRLTGDPLGWAWEEGMPLRVESPPAWAADSALTCLVPLGPRGERGALVTLEFAAGDGPPLEVLEDVAVHFYALSRTHEREARAVAGQARNREVLAALRRLPREIEPVAFGRELAESARSLAGATGAAVAIWEGDAGEVLVLVGEDGGPPAGTRFEAPHSELALAALSGASRVHRGRRSDAGALPLAGAGERWFADPRALVVIPLQEPGGDVRGVLAVWHARAPALDEDAVAGVEALAPYAALQLRNARAYGALRERAQRDALTTLHNRRAFEDRLETEQARFARYGRPVALLLLDIDHFKATNDSFGHEAGDAVLRYLGQTIRATLRDTDFAARFGGEEFVVLLPETRLEDAHAAAERLRIQIERGDVVWEGRGIPVRVSVGVSACPECVPDPIALVRSADTALYASKSAGRNRVTAAAVAG